MKYKFKKGELTQAVRECRNRMKNYTKEERAELERQARELAYPKRK